MAIVKNVTLFEALHQENEDVVSTTHLHTSQTSITLSFAIYKVLLEKVSQLLSRNCRSERFRTADFEATDFSAIFQNVAKYSCQKM